MITKTNVEQAEGLERKAWELQYEAQAVQSRLMTVVHDTARQRRQALAREMQLTQAGKANPARLAYVRARSAALQARLHMQLGKAAQQLEAVRLAVLEFQKEVDLGPLLDSCPE